MDGSLTTLPELTLSIRQRTLAVAILTLLWWIGQPVP